MLFILLIFSWASLLMAREDTWVLHLDPNIDAVQYAMEHGIKLIGPTEVHPDMYIFSADSTHKRSETSFQNCVKAQKQVKRKRYLKSATEDPLYSQQWHLHGPNSLSCVDADKTELTGAGVTIAFVDDGLEHTHPEFAGKYDARHSHNYNGGPYGDNDPMPTSFDQAHGTSASGVAVANRHNGVCGRGVAPGARLSGIRLIAAPVSDVNEGQGLSKYFSSNHIYSNSWGPADTGHGMDAPGMVVRAAFARFAGKSIGRKGLGTIYVWASGNGHEHGDTCAYDGYASNPYVNPIGAVDYNGKRSYYSEGCSALMAVAPSSGSGRGIITADLQGANGYASGDCNPTFGGTSSAAPLASGIIALLLEKNANLTWRDVKHVIALGATKIDSDNTDWVQNAGGYKHSNTYGFGLLHIPSLLSVLDTYEHVPAQQKQVFSNAFRQANLPVAGSGGTAVVFDLNGTQIDFIENVIVLVELRHPRRGQVQVSVQSPSKTLSIVGEYRSRDTNANYPRGGWHFSTVRFWGESVADGNWTVFLTDETDTTGRGEIISVQLGIFGF